MSVERWSTRSNERMAHARLYNKKEVSGTRVSPWRRKRLLSESDQDASSMPDRVEAGKTHDRRSVGDVILSGGRSVKT